MEIKSLLLTGIIAVLLMVSGCSYSKTPPENQKGSGVQDNGNIGDSEPSEVSVRPGSLGGVCLGDSSGDVLSMLGKEYKESMEADESGYIGQDMLVWEFEKGITITLGKSSNKVIRVESNSTVFSTDLGMKVGDSSKAVFEKYRPLFKEMKSRHSDDILEGWFDIGDGKLMIFRFDAYNASGYGAAENSKVLQTVLAYWKHFD